MIPIDQNKVTTLISHYDKVIDRQVFLLHKRLVKFRTSLKKRDQRAYITALISEGKNLITSDLNEIAILRQTFNAILKLDLKKPSDVKFKDKIIQQLQYKERRDDFYPLYFRKLGIKACVYCNAQLCVTAEKFGGGASAKFQVDHYISKDKYPFLSIALYNLYPVCGSCNNVKGIKQIYFDLYADLTKPPLRRFAFKLKNKDRTVAQYLNSRDPGLIKIEFTENSVPLHYKSHNEVFSIQGIYDTQTDIVEELIMKKHIYDDSYRKILVKRYKNIFGDETKLEQLIIGNYIEEKQMHNRPMAKFTRDIAIQLGIIKEK